VEGRIETRSWEGPDGVKKFRTEIIAENMQMGPKTGGGGGRSDYTPAGSSAVQEDVTPQEDEIEIKDIPF